MFRLEIDESPTPAFEPVCETDFQVHQRFGSDIDVHSFHDAGFVFIVRLVFHESNLTTLPDKCSYGRDYLLGERDVANKRKYERHDCECKKQPSDEEGEPVCV